MQHNKRKIISRVYTQSDNWCNIQ